MVATSRWNMMVPCQRICVPTMRSDSLGGAVRTVEMEKFKGGHRKLGERFIEFSGAMWSCLRLMRCFRPFVLRCR